MPAFNFDHPCLSIQFLRPLLEDVEALAERCEAEGAAEHAAILRHALADLDAADMDLPLGDDERETIQIVQALRRRLPFFDRPRLLNMARHYIGFAVAMHEERSADRFNQVLGVTKAFDRRFLEFGDE